MNKLNIAVVGAGGFAHFAVTEFIKIAGVNLIGIFDEHKPNASRLKTIDSSAIIYDSLEELCLNPAIDLVYIATPPFLHYEQTKMALFANKHVICEKPAALKMSHAVELRKIAEEIDLLFVVNLMQRYNPFYEAVHSLIKRKVLGDFLHGFFENYASDEFLTEQHWFWDEQKSGGIFIEHGVHFFDMFSGWLGEGKVISSQKIERPNYKNVWDKVQATVLYQGALVNFYHAFDQPKAMDRQEMLLQFEKGEITLSEWVPTRLKMTAICSEEEFQALQEIFPEAIYTIIEHSDTPKIAKGRFKTITYQYKISLDTGHAVEKQSLYQALVRAMLNDQIAWIDDRNHIRKINQDNAVSSLQLAEESEMMATKI